MSIGGSIQEISLNGRIFAVAADADSNRKLGGFTNEAQANGNGTARLIKTRETWMLDGLSVDTDDVRGDHEFLQDLADLKDFFPVLVTYVSGVSYQGSGQITGDLQRSSQSATAAIALNGPGKLTRQ